MGDNHETKLVLQAEAVLATMFGHLRIKGYARNGEQSVVLIKGTIAGRRRVLTRIQSSCLFGETFHATDCDCSWQVTTSLRLISRQESPGGIFIYLYQEGRGIGIFEKIKAFAVQQEFGCDTVEAFAKMGYNKGDLRTYDMAVDILKKEGVKSVCLLTNNAEKTEALETHGIPATREPLELEEEDFKKLTAHMDEDDIRDLLSYLAAKREKLGHAIMERYAARFLAQLESEEQRQ